MSDYSKLTRLLPIACLAAAICLFASELMTTFEFTPPGGEAICAQSASDRHGNAMALIAVFAVGALAIAVLAGSKPAATAVAIAGVVGLLVFLLVDLPDANAVGTINDSCGAVGQSFFDAEAVPQGGFFLEMIGALGLAVSGIALATLTPEQLTGLRPTSLRAPSRSRDAAAPADEERAEQPAKTQGTGSEQAHEHSDEAGRLSRLGRRPRTRQRR